QTFNTAPLQLAITAQRAWALGIKTEGAVTLRLNARAEVGEILSLAAATSVTRRLEASPARPAILAGIDLAKLAGRLPDCADRRCQLGGSKGARPIQGECCFRISSTTHSITEHHGMLADPARGRGHREVRGISRRYSQRPRCYCHRRAGFVLPRPRAHTFSLPDR